MARAPKRYKRKSSKRVPKVSRAVARYVNKAMSKNQETKLSINNVSPNQEYGHNSCKAAILNNLLRTVQGTGNEIRSPGERIGDAINLKGLSIRMMFEKNINTTKIQVRVMVIRTYRGYFPSNDISTSLIFRQASGTNTPTVLDTTLTRTIKICYDKTFTIYNPNTLAGDTGLEPGQGTGSGKGVFFRDSGQFQNSASKNTKILKAWITAKQLGFMGTNGKVQYEFESDDVRNFDYSLVVTPYVSYDYTTGTTCMRLNDVITQMYYKDP